MWGISKIVPPKKIYKWQDNNMNTEGNPIETTNIQGH